MKYALFPLVRRFLLAFMVLAVFTNRVEAQVSIAVCESTLSYGIAFENGEGDVATPEEIQDYAIQLCKDNGGIDCEEKYYSKEPGWYGVLTFKDQNGGTFISIAGPKAKQSDVEIALILMKEENGGGEVQSMKTVRAYNRN